MNAEKRQQLRDLEAHLKFWHQYWLAHPESKDADDTANLLGDIIRNASKWKN